MRQNRQSNDYPSSLFVWICEPFRQGPVHIQNKRRWGGDEGSLLIPFRYMKHQETLGSLVTMGVSAHPPLPYGPVRLSRLFPRRQQPLCFARPIPVPFGRVACQTMVPPGRADRHHPCLASTFKAAKDDRQGLCIQHCRCLRSTHGYTQAIPFSMRCTEMAVDRGGDMSDSWRHGGQEGRPSGICLVNMMIVLGSGHSRCGPWKVSLASFGNYIFDPQCCNTSCCILQRALCVCVVYLPLNSWR